MEGNLCRDIFQKIVTTSNKVQEYDKIRTGRKEDTLRITESCNFE